MFLSAIYVTITAVQFRKLRRWVPIFGFLEQRQYCFEIDIGFEACTLFEYAEFWMVRFG